jgi:hypothetical protein
MALFLRKLAGIKSIAIVYSYMFRRRPLGPDHPNTAVVLNNLIAFYREQGRNAEADALEKHATGKT